MNYNNVLSGSSAGTYSGDFVVWWRYEITTPNTQYPWNQYRDVYMTITLKDLCWNDVPNVTARSSNIYYTIASNTGSANAAQPASGNLNTAAATISGCDITKTLEIFNDGTGDWDD